MLNDLLSLSKQLNRQAFTQPASAGWLDSFLAVLYEQLAPHSIKGIQIVQIIGNEAMQVGRIGNLPDHAATRYLLAPPSPVDAAIRTGKAVTESGMRVYPLPVAENAVGAMVVYAEKLNQDVDELLNALTLQLGPALGRDYRVPGPRTGRLTQQIDLMRSLYEVTKTVSSALDSNEVLNRAARSMVEMLHVEHVEIIVFERRADQATPLSALMGVVLAEFPDNGIVGSKVPISEKLYQQLNAERRPIPVSRMEDADNFGLDRAFFESQGIRSIAFIPMIVRGDLVGAVSLEAYYDAHTFTPEELEGASAVTSQLAISVHNAQLYGEVKRQASQLERIADLSRQVTSTFDRWQIFQITREETRNLIDADLVSVGLRQPGATVLQFVIVGDGEPNAAEFLADETALGIVCKTGEPHLIEDIADSDLADYKLLARSGGRAVMSVPLVVGGRTIGAYCVAHHEAGMYTATTLAVLEQIGNQLGIALENARLYHEAEQRAESEQLMNQLSGSMQGRGNLQLMLLATVQEMAHALGARRARVRLQMPPAQTVDSAKMASISKLTDKLSEKREG